MIRIVYPNFYNGRLITRVIGSMAEAFLGHGVASEVFAYARPRGLELSYLQTAFPTWLNWATFRLLSESLRNRWLLHCFSNSLEAGDYAYMWPGVEPRHYEIARMKGCVVLHENINTHQAYAKRILDSEYSRLGIEQTRPISLSAIENEIACHSLADYVFCPSAIVAESVRVSSGAQCRIIQTSYGLRADEVLPRVRHTKEEEVVFLFVGSVSVRKGAHLLAEYWIKSQVKAKLRIVGPVEPALKSKLEPLFAHPSVERFDYMLDLRSAYQQADVFVFPSLEEGSPIVTYQAMGAGLTLLVSPMGGGGVVVNGQTGIVIDPYDEQAWINAIRFLASNSEIHEDYRNRARQDRAKYMWSAVAAERLSALVGGNRQ